MNTPLNPRMKRLCSFVIDGTDESGSYAGDAQHGPWVVFCVDLQENVAGPFRWRWQASFWCWRNGVQVLNP